MIPPYPNAYTRPLSAIIACGQYLRQILATSRVRRLLVGRTVRLQEDLEVILAHLGYSGAAARVNVSLRGLEPCLPCALPDGRPTLESLVREFSSFHCGVLCPQTPGQAHIPTVGSLSLRTVGSFNDVVRERLSNVRRTRWYDERTALKVVALFSLDFAAFNFSTDASLMFEAPPPMQMPADGEQLFAELMRTSSHELVRTRP